MVYLNKNLSLRISISSNSSLVLLLGVFFFSACTDSKIQTLTWTEFEPVYMTEQEFISAVKMDTIRDLENPGKIYFSNGFLFVNELNKGIHIIDNSDPSSPVNIGFLTIPATRDIAVRGNFLYADSNSDLLVFNIENIESPELVSRKKGVFLSLPIIYLSFPYRDVDPALGIVVDWKEVEHKETCESEDCYIVSRRFGNDAAFSVLNASSSPSNNTAIGVGGSMARFAISGDYLYAVDLNNLITLDISSVEPDITHQEEVSWGIETIFPYQENIYLGSRSAMYIYSIADQRTPSLLSVYEHLTSCDPVVVEGNLAYVTLREGSACLRGVNRLEIINIEDPTNPQEIAIYDMIHPHGLGIDGNHLFISEGDNGIKVLDVTDPLNVKELRHITDIKTFDVIPHNNVLMITGSTGIVQYDYSNINEIAHLSTIPVLEK